MFYFGVLRRMSVNCRCRRSSLRMTFGTVKCAKRNACGTTTSRLRREDRFCKPSGWAIVCFAESPGVNWPCIGSSVFCHTLHKHYRWLTPRVRTLFLHPCSWEEISVCYRTRSNSRATPWPLSLRRYFVSCYSKSEKSRCKPPQKISTWCQHAPSCDSVKCVTAYYYCISDKYCVQYVFVYTSLYRYRCIYYIL